MILLKIRNEHDLYNRFDPAQTRLSEDVYGYIKTCYEEIPLAERKDVVLRIQTDESVNEKTVKTLLNGAVDRELASMDKKLRENRVKMTRLYIIGIVLILIGFALALSLDQLILEVISIVGSMAVKDAATIQIENNPEIKLRKRLLEQLKNVKVES